MLSRSSTLCVSNLHEHKGYPEELHNFYAHHRRHSSASLLVVGAPRGRQMKLVTELRQHFSYGWKSLRLQVCSKGPWRLLEN